MLVASVISGILGWTYAFISERLSRFHSFWRLLPIVSVSLPLYIHAASWEATFGKFGWMQLSAVAGREFAFSGMIASVWIHGVTGAAWVAMIVALVLRRGPVGGEEAALLESGLSRTALKVVLPATYPATLLAMMFVALIAATEISVVDLYAYRTLADEVYFQYALSPKPMPFIFAMSMPLMIVAILIAFAFSHRTALLRPLREDGSRRLDYGVEGPIRAVGLNGLLVAISCILVFLPLASLVVKAGWTVSQQDGEFVASWTLQRTLNTIISSLTTFNSEFKWSLALAGAVVFLTLPLAFAMSILARRWTKSVVGCCLLLLLIPGPVVCVVMMSCFSWTHNVMLIDIYERTLLPTAVCVLHRSLPACSFILIGAQYMRSWNINEAAEVDGAGFLTTLLRVDLPLQAQSLGLCALVAGVISLGEVSATELVLPAGVSTVARRVFGLLHSGVRYQESGLCLISCGFVISLVLLWSVFMKSWVKRSADSNLQQ